MITPSGRFACNRRLCLSMSDYHPESWNPLWSVASILNGLLSFMLDKTPTLGSIETSDNEKRKLAAQSMECNTKDAVFRKLFPALVKNFQQNLVIQNQVSQQTVVEDGDDDTVIENDQNAQKNRILNTDNHNNANDILNFRGGVLLKAVSVAVTAVVFVLVLTYAYNHK